MIVWLAAWPHCGSTLARIFLKEVFGLPSFSKYYEEKLVFLFGQASLDFTEEWSRARLPVLQESDDLFIIKTHEAPLDDSPAIFVQRDGRAAMTGLARFWEAPLRRIIVGEGFTFCDWSTFARVWDPFRRPQTEVLLFEEILQRPGQATAVLRDCFGWQPLQGFRNEFENYNQRWPKLFSKRPHWSQDFSPEDLELFCRLHGAIMETYGYTDAEVLEEARA
jgi:hypothetical protein